MVDRVGSEGEVSIVGILNLQKKLLVFIAEALEIRRVNQNAQVDFGILSVASADVADDTDQSALDLDTHCAS